MRFLLTSYEYPGFVKWLYQGPSLDTKPYAEQLDRRARTDFLWSNYYSRNLAASGQEAEEVVPGSPFLQDAWAREHGLRPRKRKWEFRWRRGFIPWLTRPVDPRWMLTVFAAQVRSYRPDVLLIRDIGSFSGAFLRQLRPYARLIVGQHASPLDQRMDYGEYDLILSSLPNFVDYFRSQGIPSEMLRLGFEATVVDRLTSSGPGIDVSFVGKLAGDHQSRARFLNELCQKHEVELWGPSADGLSRHAADRYRGPAWGMGMFELLSRSRISINQHEEWAGPHANNLRLFEATGVGTLLLTDWKDDLAELFEPEREVVTYRNTEECCEKIDYYLAHNDERDAIAAAGQRRTLNEHTYAHRMVELMDILKKYL